MTRSALVIGAGVVGISCALQMARRGLDVTVIDRGPPGSGTSHGNAGAILRAAMPVATPGLLRDVPRMLLDPTGPLTLRWSYLPRLAPWLLRLVRESAPARAEANSRAIWALGRDAPGAWRRQTQGTPAADLLHPVGWLTVYETERAFAADRAEREMRERRGISHDILTADELRELEPNLAPIFRRGVLQADALFASDPRRLVEACADAARALGVTIRQGEVRRVAADDDRASATLADGEELTADRLVLAAGAWSRDLAAQLGARVPLDTERGYHLMLPTPARGLTRPTVNGDRSFVLCPMAGGLRLTSQVELAGLEAPPDYRRVHKLLPAARRMLPGLAGEPTDRWLGFRPSLPDSRPVLGPVPGAGAALLAFGHQHYGLSLAARTGELIADLAAGETPDIDLSPYRPDR